MTLGIGRFSGKDETGGREEKARKSVVLMMVTL